MKKFYTLVIVMLFSQLSFAQNSNENLKRYYHRSPQSLSRSYNGESQESSTGQSGTGSNIDVVYHRLEWRINPDSSKAVKGKVTTYFKTSLASVSAISFDLNQASFNNANLTVTYHGTTCARSVNASNVLSITLPSIIAATNTLDSVVINYYGVPPGVVGQAEGYQLKTIATHQMIYTLSESYEDRDWWPCKADMQDKIDSLDIIISTPLAHTPATNGLLVSTVTSGTNKIYTYKHRYPIASYLVAVGVTKYNLFARGTVNISGTNMPVEYHISQGRGVNPTAALTAMDFCKQELVAFSTKFGDYPFKNEKYAMYEFGWGGGMEHQTNSAMSYGSMTSWGVIAHELSHQWFGDKVTFSTWNHLWLAEGFGRYSEALAAELVPALGQSAATTRAGFKSAANGASLRAFACYIPNAYITSSDVMWSSAYGSSVYERGAMVVSMLRTLMGDTKFFQACRNYLDDPLLAFKSATTEDLRAHMEAELGGFDLSGFFNSYVYGSGYPTSQVNWGNPAGKTLNIRINTQTKTSAGATTYFKNVIPLRVQGAGAGQDTLIVIYDQDGNNLAKAGDGIDKLCIGNFLTYELSFVPTTVTFDPYSMSLSAGSALKTSVVDIKLLNFNVLNNAAANDAYLSLDGNAANNEVMLERSADGIHYHELGLMNALQPTSTQRNYFFKDSNPIKGTNFYRAKYKNFAGLFTFSSVVKLSSEKASYFVLMNNPVKSVIQLSNPSDAINKNAQFNLYDMGGKQLLAQTIKISGSVTDIKLPSISTGVYLLEINLAGENIQTTRLMIN